MTGGVYIESEEEALAHYRSALNWAGEAIFLERPVDEIVSEIDRCLRQESVDAIGAIFWAYRLYAEVATGGLRTYVREGSAHALIFNMADHGWSFGPSSGQGTVFAIAAATGESPAEIARRVCELVGAGLFTVMTETIAAIATPGDDRGVGA